MKVSDIAVHHAASSDAARMEDIKRYHVEVLGWRDVGYHYLIELDGTLRVGRPANQVGAHVGQYNSNFFKRTYILGVCILGNTHNRPMTAAQRRTLVQLLAILCKRHGLGIANVKMHRQIMPGLTECPGRYTVADFPAICNEVAAYLPERRLAA